MKYFLHGISLLTLSLAACSGRQQNALAPVENYVALSAADCPGTKLNGTWKLVAILEEGHKSYSVTEQLVTFSNCSSASYYQNGKLTHTDSFKTFRVTQYCADYQLNYPGDSISCINFTKDTLIIGACSGMETRYCYKKQ